MSKVNKNFFFKESPELFYILGLWASDGCVYKNTMQISLTDRDVIEWIADQIEYNGEIKEIENYGDFTNPTEHVTSVSHFLRFNGKDIRKVFNKYGVYANKSLTMEFPKSIPEEYIKDYIRGVFDGDGGIYVANRTINGRQYARSKIHFTSGSREFLEGLKDVIESELGNNIKITKGTRCFIYAFESKRDVLSFGKWIYEDDEYGMPRKKEVIMKLINGEKVNESEAIA